MQLKKCGNPIQISRGLRLIASVTWSNKDNARLGCSSCNAQKAKDLEYLLTGWLSFLPPEPSIKERPLETRGNLALFCCCSILQPAYTSGELSTADRMAAPPKPLSVDIHTSVKDGDMAKVVEFLEEGGDVNVRCRCGDSNGSVKCTARCSYTFVV